jgi:serine/threonine protein kinase
MAYNPLEDEHDEIIALNGEMTSVALESSLVDVQDLNRAHRIIEKAHMRGDTPPLLFKCLKEEGFIEDKVYRQLNKTFRQSRLKEEIRGYQFKNYEPIREIGSGGLGKVILARQRSMMRLVAIKILHSKWAEDVELRSRFLLEARVQGRLSHQNLVQIYDVSKEGPHYIFSMEYVGGMTLEQLIHKEGQLSLERALEISLQICRAINYISGLQIVHRDIKPANVLIDQHGVAKLGDFGFLHSKHETNLKTDGTVVGTPDYISPEQARGDTVDQRSDIYSLGVCIYQMLTGDLPYSGTVSMIMRKHVSADLPGRSYGAGQLIPTDIYNIIIKMMAKDPDDRYSNTEELMSDLQFQLSSENMRSSDKKVSEKREQKVQSVPLITADSLDALYRSMRRQMIAVVILTTLILLESFYLFLQ